MAQDKDAEDAYVAVKVCVSDKTIASQEKEVIQNLLHSTDDRTSMILPILDAVVHDGPNGQHPCTVTPPARMSLASAKSATHGYNIFPLPVARAIAAQLAQVVAFCHAQGVVHGDLYTGNILLRFAAGDDIHSLSGSAFYDRFGQPFLEPVERFDAGSGGPRPALDHGVPTHAVVEAWLGCRPQDVTIAESFIYLADFGESYMPSGPRTEAHTYCHAPPRVTPPEAHFATGELGFPADIWALACVIWDVFGGCGSLFGSAFFQGDDQLRRDWVDVFGRLPDEWWDAWDGDYRRDLFTEDGAVREDRRDDYVDSDPGLEGRFELMVQGPRREEDMQKVSDEEKTALLKMLRAMLSYEPADRIKAQDVLGTEWMLSYGLPALSELKRLGQV
jgi:serine/threonine protein kinase